MHAMNIILPSLSSMKTPVSPLMMIIHAIIFADACSNSDTDDLNIGQAMLKQGGVGFLGATKVAYGMSAWNDPYDGSSQSLDLFLYHLCHIRRIYTRSSSSMVFERDVHKRFMVLSKVRNVRMGINLG